MAGKFILEWKPNGSSQAYHYRMANYDGNFWVATGDTNGLEDKTRSVLNTLPADWEAGVKKTLDSLFGAKAPGTSTAVQARINGAGTKVMIIPERSPGNASTEASDYQAATPKDEPRYAKCQDRKYDENDKSTWQRCQVDPDKPKGTPGRRVEFPGVREYVEELKRNNPSAKWKDHFGECRKKFGKDKMPHDADALAEYCRPPRTPKKTPGE